MERYTQMFTHTHSRRHAACANTPLIQYSDLPSLASKGKLPGMTGSFQAAFHQFLRVCSQFRAGLTWGNCVKWSVRPGILTSINTVLLRVWKEHNISRLWAGFNLLYVLLPSPDDKIIINGFFFFFFLNSSHCNYKLCGLWTSNSSLTSFTILLGKVGESVRCWSFSVGISRWLKTVMNPGWCWLLSVIEYSMWAEGIFQPKRKLYDHSLSLRFCGIRFSFRPLWVDIFCCCYFVEFCCLQDQVYGDILKRESFQWLSLSY